MPNLLYYFGILIKIEDAKICIQFQLFSIPVRSILNSCPFIPNSCPFIPNSCPFIPNSCSFFPDSRDFLTSLLSIPIIKDYRRVLAQCIGNFPTGTKFILLLQNYTIIISFILCITDGVIKVKRLNSCIKCA